MALDYLVLFLRETNATKNVINKAQDERIKQLDWLCQQSSDKLDRAQYQLRLAAALEESGEEADLLKANTLFQKVSSFKGLPEKPLRQSAIEALARISKSKRR